MTLFGFAQLDFPGVLSLADGRYVLRDGETERVLVVETDGAPPPPRRRRRKPRAAEAEQRPLPLTRVTFVRASDPFEEPGPAEAWLEGTSDDEESVDALLAEALAAVNEALHTQAVASADAQPQSVSAARAAAVRLGYGSGEQVADGEFTAAREVDVHVGAAPRRRRDEELRPQERVAAVLGGRERLDACETLLLRARADLDAGRNREAALQLRAGLEALLVELAGALDDPGHTEDMATLESRREEAVALADAALQGNIDAKQHRSLIELLNLGERALRRRRVLRG